MSTVNPLPLQLPDRNAIRIDPVKAFEEAQGILAIAESEQDELLTLQSLATCVRCLVEQTNYVESRCYLERAFPLAQKLRNSLVLCDLLGSQGRLISETEGRNRAIPVFKEALAVAERTPDNDSLLTVTLVNLGTCHSEIGEYHAALRYFLRALDLCERTGNAHHKAGVLANTGSIYRYLRDYHRALTCLTDALAIIQSIGDQVGKVILLGGIGLVHLSEARYDEAMSFFRQKLELAHKLSMPTQQSMALSDIGNVHELRGELEQALGCYQQALAIDSSNARRSIELQCYIASLSIKMGQTETVLPRLLEILDSPAVEGELRIHVRAHQLLAELYEQLGDIAHAYHHYRQHKDILEEVHGSQKQQEIANLRAEYEHQLQQQEQELLAIRAAQLHQENEHMTKELSLLATNLSQKRESLERITAELKVIAAGTRRPRQSAQRLMTKVREMLGSEQDWQSFERRFQHAHANFIKLLTESYPTLTPTELKICSLLKVNCSTKDMAQLLCVSATTIDWHRRSIRRKLGITAGINLITFIAGL